MKLLSVCIMSLRLARDVARCMCRDLCSEATAKCNIKIINYMKDFAFHIQNMFY